jgi:predicted acylesterase/phospholipase RssA
MASGALPPGFPAVEIDGEHYWDGGLVSNTPLQWVIESNPRRQDTLAFQVDLWSSQGDIPSNPRRSPPDRRKFSFQVARARAPAIPPSRFCSARFICVSQWIPPKINVATMIALAGDMPRNKSRLIR